MNAIHIRQLVAYSLLSVGQFKSNSESNFISTLLVYLFIVLLLNFATLVVDILNYKKELSLQVNSTFPLTDTSNSNLQDPSLSLWVLYWMGTVTNLGALRVVGGSVELYALVWRRVSNFEIVQKNLAISNPHRSLYLHSHLDDLRNDASRCP